MDVRLGAPKRQQVSVYGSFGLRESAVLRLQGAGFEGQDSTTAPGEIRVVSDDQGCRSVPPLELQHEVENLRPTLGIEVPGGLVGEQQGRLQKQCPAQSHTLAFAAGKLIREVIPAICQTDLIQEHAGPSLGIRVGTAGDPPGHHDILDRREIGQELLELEDETNGSVSESSQLPRVELAQVLSTDLHHSRIG